jgi:putative membrane protein
VVEGNRPKEMTTMRTIPLLMAGGWHHGHHWWIVFPILLLLLIAAAIALFWRRGRSPGDGNDSSRRILGERFARGEINADEYRERLAQLR